ncbi:MAG: phosphate ABC transporter permease PstA [Candidatus Ancillula sp.]|jgi:phosphate transport system permease protein|nr:phosphate ABC transporter permease PstA [Candidatus Ancillula sp.]
MPKAKTPSRNITTKQFRLGSTLIKAGVFLSIGVAIISTFYLIGYILVQGVPNLTSQLFEWEYSSENASLIPALINTVVMTFGALLVACPVGIFAAVYLTQYTSTRSRFVHIVQIAAETLTGIPSIVYGLFGMLMFVTFFGWGYSLLAGVCTLAIMVLPLIMRATEEALLAVDPTFREASFGLGAGKTRTIFKVLLPAASGGILSGIILAVGRIVGETAALIFTAGTVAQVATSAFSSARTLSVHMYALSSEGLFVKQAYATAVVLLILVIIINAVSALLSRKLANTGSSNEE